MKYYAVYRGRKTGIFTSWNECKAQVNHYKGAVFKSFESKAEAEKFLHKGNDSTMPNVHTENQTEYAYAFTDGSFNEANGKYGFGGFLVDNHGIKHIIQGNGCNPEFALMRNVAGEILGAECAIMMAISLGIKDLIIYYDYSGVECWAKGMWKANKPKTKEFADFVRSSEKLLNISFKHVKAHTGIEGNEQADRLAKEAVGIC